MKITFLAIGKKHDSDISLAINDFTSRISHYTSVEWQLIPAPKADLNAAQSRRAESLLLTQKITPDDKVILLDETGKQLSSPALSVLLDQHAQRGTKRLVFIIGGAYGVDETLQNRADFVWSLSDLVFPHQIVRLILAEQVYRAYTIMRGEKYHHAA